MVAEWEVRGSDDLCWISPVLGQVLSVGQGETQFILGADALFYSQEIGTGR
jgi:hypothetical protein